MTVLAGRQHPVLAHLFLDYLLDADHALEQLQWLGYQPPQNEHRPGDRSVADGYVPAHLDTRRSSGPRTSTRGYQLLQLSPGG